MVQRDIENIWSHWGNRICAHCGRKLNSLAHWSSDIFGLVLRCRMVVGSEEVLSSRKRMGEQTEPIGGRHQSSHKKSKVRIGVLTRRPLNMAIAMSGVHPMESTKFEALKKALFAKQKQVGGSSFMVGAVTALAHLRLIDSNQQLKLFQLK